MIMKHPAAHARLASAAVASLVLCTPAFGQWAVRVEVGADRFWGGSIEKAAERRSFRPYRPTDFGLSLQRTAGNFGLGIRLQYSTAGLALEGSDGASVANGIFTVYSASPELVYRIASFASVNRLMLHAGPLFEVWSVLDEGSEARIGIQGALSLRVPLGRRLSGSLIGGAALIGSPFAGNQLDPDFERRALWRRRFAIGLEYRL